MILVAIDAVATYLWLKSGLAVEGNPFAALMIEWFGAWFFVVRSFLAVCSGFFVWSLWEWSRVVRWMSVGVTLVYTAVFIWHGYNFCLLFVWY